MDQNNEQAMNNNPATGEKTFTQEQVNAIIGERLAKEKAKSEAALAEREKAIKARELAIMAAEKLAAAGLPKDLSAVLKYEDEASLEAAINQLSTLRGFKQEKKSERVYEENRLPEGEPNYGDSVTVQLRKAMGLR